MKLFTAEFNAVDRKEKRKKKNKKIDNLFYK